MRNETRSIVSAAACCAVLLFSMSGRVHSQALRLALESRTPPVVWPAADQLQDKKNLPLIVIDLPWPLASGAPLPAFPPDHVPVLLRLAIADPSREVGDQDLDSLNGLLRSHGNISHLVIAPTGRPDRMERLFFLIKQVSAQARGALADLQIAIELDNGLDDDAMTTLARSLAGDSDIAPYFDAFLCRRACEKLRQTVNDLAPRFVFWQWLDTGAASAPQETLSRIVTDDQFEKSGTTLLLVPVDDAGKHFSFFSRFASYLETEMFRTAEKVPVHSSGGETVEMPLFVRKQDLSHFVFFGISGTKGQKLSLEKGEYQEARIENIVTGERFATTIRKHAKSLVLRRQDAFLAIELVPRPEGFQETKTKVEVRARYRPSVEEIVARVRAWDAVQRSRLQRYMATMTVSLRLKVANLEETFDLTTRGPVFLERGKPYDWVWKEFYINGVRWKGRVAPKIPLLQPEKVNMLPFAIDLNEGYQYAFAGETTYNGHQAYMIDFNPRPKFEMQASYRGRIYVDTSNFARLYMHVIQLNLMGDVLSNVETQTIEPVPGSDDIWMPLTIVGHQVFSTGGRVTNVERKVTLTQMVVNPPDLEAKRAEALQSDLQMVRDTDQGLRYLVKDKKEGKRVVEWAVKKSQFAVVLGTFYDSSLSLPLPILGVTYINFNLGGKGRQVNVLFGGALLQANYSDPAFLGTRADFGGDIYAIALPSSNTVYRSGASVQEEKIKSHPFRLQVNFGFPLSTYMKFTSTLSFNYFGFSRADDTADAFVLPKSGVTTNLHLRLNMERNGYSLSFWGTYGRRGSWDFWGMPGNSDYDPAQRSFIRWRLLAGKDFFFSNFRRLHLAAGYFDGIDMDRFSAFEFGFFSELKLHGFKTGSVRAERAWTFNASYGYSVGEAFRLEAYYDSALVTNRRSGYDNTYFSGVGISGTTNIPGFNSIVRFDIGVPVVGQGIKGFALYFVLLKMF